MFFIILFGIKEFPGTPLVIWDVLYLNWRCNICNICGMFTLYIQILYIVLDEHNTSQLKSPFCIHWFTCK